MKSITQELIMSIYYYIVVEKKSVVEFVYNGREFFEEGSAAANFIEKYLIKNTEEL